MKLRWLAALFALGGAVALAGWVAVDVANFDSGSIDSTDLGGQSVATKGPSLDLASAAAVEEETAVAVPVADAAVVHVSLLSPHPMLVPNGAPAQATPMSNAEPAEQPVPVTGSF